MTSLARDALLSRSVFEELVQAGGQAPSPDNNQPWAFRQAGDAVEVYHCRERALPSDVRDMFSWIALGAAIENIAVRASAHTLQATVEHNTRPFLTRNGNEHVATVRLVTGGSPDPLQQFIEDRVTNRRLYSKRPLTDQELRALGHSIRRPRSQIFWVCDRAERRKLAELVAICDRIRFEHRPFHEEFHKVLRYGREEARRTGDGLELKTLELPPGGGLLMRWLRPWKRMQFANRLGMSRLFANYSVKQIMRCGAVGLLTTDDSSDIGYLEAGRSLQRVWLQATQLGLAFQPMGALPLFLTKLVDQEPGGWGVELQAVHDGLARLMPRAIGQAPVMLVRIGRSRGPTARSGRYSEHQITLKAGDRP